MFPVSPQQQPQFLHSVGSLCPTMKGGRRTAASGHSYLHTVFEKHGEVVARYPFFFLVAPVLLTLALSTGLTRFRQDVDVSTLYTPVDAPYLREKMLINRFYGMTNSNQSFRYVQLVAEVENGNVLHERILHQVLRINDFIMNELNYTLDGQMYNFGKRICEKQFQCLYGKAIFTAFIKLYMNFHNEPNPNVRFSFPLSTAWETNLFIGHDLMGVRLYPNGTIRDAKVINLLYTMVASDQRTNAEIDMFDDELEAYVADLSQTIPDVKFYLLSDRFMEKEVIKSSMKLVPLIALLLFFMFTFSILSNSSRKPLKNKPLEGAAGCLSSTMAILSSIGLLLHLNIAFNGTVYAVPFITMAIGICDSFLTIQAWKLTDPRLPAEKRLSQALSEAGSAITVTSLTDIALFAVGLLSETPAIKIFSIFATVAMTFDYLYQITFFVAVILLNGRRETEQKVFCFQSLEERYCTGRHRKHMNVSVGVSDFLRNTYAPFLCKRSTKIVGLTIYVLYLFVSFWFTSRIRVHFTPTKLVSDDSPLVSYAEMFDRYQVYSRELQIFVLNPPDFRNESTISRVLEFVHELETTKYSGGEKTTNLWLRSYIDFMQLYGWESEEFYEHVTEFLNVLQFKHYIVQIRLTDDKDTRVEKFYFTTNFHTSLGVDEWNQILKLCREICNRYAELEAAVDIGYQAMVTDQLASIVPNTLQTVSTAFICLMVMSAFVIPRLYSIFLVGLMLFSMDLGVIGFLCLWNVDLDPVSIINIVISLDFAVEYAVHICHFYYKSQSSDPHEKLRHSLGTVGWPVMQGGLTTILGVLPFSFTKLYISQAFMKTCLLVVFTGSFHAFVVVPILLLISSGRPPKEINNSK